MRRVNVTASRRRLRVGILGGGFGLTGVLPAIRLAGATPTVFCHPNPVVARRGASRHGIAAWATSARDVAKRPDVDLVWVATPPSEHYSQVMEAVRHGKSVVCEKPLATSTEQAEEMVDHARRAGVLNIVDHEYRLTEGRSTIRRLITEAAVGPIAVAAVADFSSRLANRNAPVQEWWLKREMSGGHLGAVGSHWIDTLRWWFGDMSRVGGSLGRVHPTRLNTVGEVVEVTADDTFSLTLAFESGVTAAVQSSCATAVPQFDLRLFGHLGTITVDASGQIVIEYPERKYVVARGNTEKRVSGVSADEELKALAGLVSYAARGLGAPELGCDPERGSIADFQDGLRVQEVLDAIYQSDASSAPGRPLDGGRTAAY